MKIGNLKRFLYSRGTLWGTVEDCARPSFLEESVCFLEMSVLLGTAQRKGGLSSAGIRGNDRYLLASSRSSMGLVENNTYTAKGIISGA